MADRRKKWSDSGPLVVSALALILLLTVLPSALNLPQSNPSQTLEYAPVPPEDGDQPPDVSGNLSSLGLGSSGSPGQGTSSAAEIDGPLDVPGGRANRPSTKRCVGSPPRQTEDPMSPPCVAFAAMSASEANEQAYLNVHTSRGVMYFTGVGGLAAADRQPAEYYQRHAPHAWSFDPDVERWADLYVSYVCQKVKGYPVAHATGGADTAGRPLNGQPRRYAFVSTTDARFPGVQHFAALAKAGLRACGVDGPEYTYPTQGAGIGVDAEGRGVTTVSDMRQRGITTLLWLGGTEPNLANAADDQRYYPEIVVAGDGAVDRNGMARLQRPNFWRNAWLVTSEVRLDSVEAAPWVSACREGDPELTRNECDYAFQFYRKLFMLFKAVQTAGPQLTPRSVDTGMHAIPEIQSSSAYLATCYFRPGDFSCVKDGAEEWWDPNGVVDGQRPGRWRMVRGGRRYLPGRWEGGDDVFRNASDPCNAFSSSGTLYD